MMPQVQEQITKGIHTMKTFTKVMALLLALLCMIPALASCGKEKVTAKVIDIPLTSEEYAFAVNPNDPELLASVNAFLKEIKGNGKFDEILSHYFGEGTPVAVTSAQEDAGKDQLVVVTEPGFEPFEYTNGDKFLGVDMEMAKLLADYLGKELVIKVIDFDSIFETLNTNGADIGMAGITVKPDREKLVKFSDTYYNAAQKLIVKSTDTKFADCKTKEDVEAKLKELDANVKIGVQTGTTGQAYVKGDEGFGFAGLTAKAEGFTNGSLAVTAMLNGDVEYVIIDEAPAACITKAINALQ